MKSNSNSQCRYTIYSTAESAQMLVHVKVEINSEEPAYLEKKSYIIINS